MATVLEPTTESTRRSRRRRGDTGAAPAHKHQGLLGLDHHRRPQAHRHPLRRHRVHVLHVRRRRGAADPPAAGPAERHVPVGGPVQPALHHARHDDDLPRRHADLGGVLQLLRADHDRRARRRLPAPQRVQLLDVPVRRAPHQLELLPRRRAQRRLVRLRAEHVDHVLTRSQHRLLDLRSADPRHRLDGRCRELHRHHPQSAGAGHGAVPHAGVRVDDARRQLPAAVRHADHHRGAVPAHVRPAVRRQLLQPGGGR